MKKYLFMLLAVAFAACNSDEPKQTLPENPADKPQQSEPVDTTAKEENPTIEDKPWEYTENIHFSKSAEQANASFNKFSFKFLNRASATVDNTVDDNLSVSPLSASLFLAMVANSCDDATSKQIAWSMGCSDVKTLNDVSNQLLRYLPHKGHESVLHLANSVWYPDAFTIDANYTQHMKNTFNAGVFSVDMADRATVGLLNKWCSDNTDGLISHMWDEIPADTKLIWMNALYFGGDWAEKIDKSLSRRAEFKGTKGIGSVNMMCTKIFTTYSEIDGYKLVNIPFKGGINSMVLVLPDEDLDIFEASETFTYEKWETMFNRVEVANATINFPSFKVEKHFGIDKILADLGMDLTAVTISPTGIPGVFPITAAQKTVMIVNEEGATGAAVTGGMDLAPIDTKPRKVEITFDRPFLFFVQNVRTGSILMAGRVCNI